MKSEKMKICHVITRMIVGGAQENTLFTIKDHIAKGHEVVLLTGPSPGREGELLALTDGGSCKVVVLDDLVRAMNLRKDWAAYSKMRNFFRENDFDVVHTHSSKAGIIGRLAAWHAGVPVVVHTIHGLAFGAYESWWRNKLYIFLERIAARHCHRIFSVAQAMIDQCEVAKIAPDEKFKVVYSGMEINDFLQAKPSEKLRESLGIAPGVPVIATVARLFPKKGYEYVIPAAEKVLVQRPDTHFLIIGDGPLFADIQAELARKNMADNFHFAGLVAPGRVHEYLSLADMLWHLSLREGLPRAVVQALACGKPAIGFELDGTPEVVISGVSGYCVAPEAIDEVATQALALLNDPETARRLGANGRELVAEKFDHRYMSDILEEEYLELLHKARARS